MKVVYLCYLGIFVSVILLETALISNCKQELDSSVGKRPDMLVTLYLE